MQILPLPKDLDAAHRTITALRLEIARLEALAMIDPLTGIANRRMFDTAMAAAFSRSNRTKKPLSVVVIDLDNFKRRNDTYGHAEGDRCLKSMAHSLRFHLRLSDTAARIGGEEFALILPDTNQEQALDLCARIAQSVRDCCGCEPLTFSAGVAQKDASMAAGSTIVDYADKAMYEAKRAGKDRAHAYEQAFRRSIFKRG
jgi:diguanylate cyclase (GGDEF)-like protein